MVEQFGYPLKDGVGINFHSLLAGGKSVLKTESGRTASSETDAGMISIRDDKFCMEAIYDDNILQFSIVTRDQETGERHPDFFASRFVDLAINHFESKGLIISKIRDVWPKWSDNYFVFMEEYVKSHDKIVAARSTWSAAAYAGHGFTELNEGEVIINNYHDYPAADAVIAYFRKSE